MIGVSILEISHSTLNYALHISLNEWSWIDFLKKFNLTSCIVADSDPGCGIRCLFDPWIRDPV
jgi:hypothetical protein